MLAIPDPPSAALPFPVDSTTGALFRATDWSKSSLGPIDAWPSVLKAMVQTVLRSREPMLIYWGPELAVLYNDAAIEILGYKHPAAMGQGARECWAEAWPTIGPQLADVVTKGQGVRYENALVPIYRHGVLENVWWNYSYSPLFDGAGAIAGALVVVNEVTAEVVARRQRDEANRRAELAQAELQSVFMQAPLPMCIVTGPDHRFRLANASYGRLVGRDVLGKTLGEAFTGEEAGYYAPVLDRVFRTGEPTMLREAPLRLPDAEGVVKERYIDVGYSPHRGDDGVVLGSLVVVHDVTTEVASRRELARLAQDLEAARHRADVAWERLDQMFRNAPAFIALLRTPAHIFEITNPAYQQLIGHRDVIGKTAREALPEVEGQGFFELLDRVYATGEAFVGQELPIRLRRTPGAPEDEAFVTFTYDAFRDASGAISGVIAFGFEVTEMVAARRRIEDLAAQHARARAQAEELHRRAEAANELKDQFLATVSHELRTPLNAMLGWMRMLRAGDLDPATRERALEVVERNAVVQAQLIDDLLDVSRILAGKLRLELSSVELGPIVEAAADAVRPALNAKNIRFHAAIDPDAGPLVADASRLQQVVWNLLANAAKFTPKGGRVALTVTRAGSSIELSVADSGQGIRPEFLPQVFDRFKQADGATTRAHSGLGLGLSIVRHVVELHGGTAEAFSEGEGRGATFVVRLPAAALRPSPQSPRQAHPTAWVTPAFECPPALRGLRVLVVDDEADTRELLVAVLLKCGAVPSAAGSAAEAMASLHAAPPDVLLSDIGMPGTDGYALIAQVRALDDPRLRHVPAAALTAYARAEDRRRALRAGFQMHVPKPVEPAELVAVVENLARIGAAMRGE